MLIISCYNVLTKTYKNLFKDFISFNNFSLAYKKARRGKRYKKYASDFYYNLPSNLIQIRKQLLNQSYQFSPYKTFYVYDPKKRLIKAPCFQDRIVHHALCNIIEPIFDRKFIYDSYACRRNKGTHKAVKRLQIFLRKMDKQKYVSVYVLKMDVSKYFPSINHQILFQLIQKKIADPKILDLIRKLLNTSATENEYDYLFHANSYFRTKKPRGIPIGNLTSQLFANIYLNQADQFIKHQLKVKYYIRYMDDSVILAENKEYLHQVEKEIVDFLYEKLYLTVNPKKIRIFPANKGIDFLGYVVFKDHILLRSLNVRKFRKKYKQFLRKIQTGQISEEKANQSIQSWIAHAKQADTYQLRKQLFNENSLPNRPSYGQLRLFD